MKTNFINQHLVHKLFYYCYSSSSLFKILLTNRSSSLLLGKYNSYFETNKLLSIYSAYPSYVILLFGFKRTSFNRCPIAIHSIKHLLVIRLLLYGSNLIFMGMKHLLHFLIYLLCYKF